MKYCAAVCVCFLMVFQIIPNDAFAKSKQASGSSSGDWSRWDFGVGLGVWLPGTVTFSNDGGSADFGKNTNFIFKGFIDYFLTNHISLGFYSHLAPSISYSDASRTQTMAEIGASFKAKFNASDAISIKPGAGVGYRTYSGSDDEASGYNALGVNFSLELQYRMNNGIIAFVEPGFLTQPVGGNGAYGMTYAPIIYCLAGVAY